MKKLFLLSLFLVTSVFYAQTSGITYQAIIYNPNGEVIPGENNANAPIVNKSICLQFSIVDAFTQTEYQERITTTTDEFGMVNVVIGSGNQTSGYASSFSDIYWTVSQKSLKVALDMSGQCNDFVQISNQNFNSVPFAFAANSAENVSGVVPIQNGGTNAITVLGAKTNLGLENVDNTSDLNKPLSTATVAALNLKENLANKSNSVTTDGTSTTKYPTVKSVKDYVDASAAAGTAALANEAGIRAAADTTLTNNLAIEVSNRTNADTVLTNNLASEVTRATTAENTIAANLTAETAARTAAVATLTTNLATEITNRTAADLLKEDLANKSINVTTDGTSDTKYPSVKSVKTYVDASAATSANALANEVTRATTAENTIAANLTAEINNRTAADLLKEDKVNKSINVTTDGTSDTKYPSVKSVKTYVDASAATSSTALSNEVTRATTAENTIAANLTAEITNRTAADLLKEDVANKSLNVTTDGASDTKYPSVKSVKTYVDANATTSSTALANEVTRATTAENTIAANLTTEINNRTAADLLKEDKVNKSINVTTDGASDVKYPSVKSVKTYVDASVAASSTALSNEVTRATTAENTIAANLTTEITNRTAADLLKEDVANKSTNVTTDGASDTKYPSVKSVKTYVDASAATSSTALANEVTRATTAENTIAANLTTEITNRTAADLLKEDVANKSINVTTDGTSDTKYPSVKSVKTYVDASAATSSTALANEVTRATIVENSIASNLTTEITNRTAADLLKEDVANKSTNVTTDGTSDTKYPTVKAVKDYVDANSSSGGGGVAGSDTQVTFNNAGVAAGSANLTWNNTTNTLSTANAAVTALGGSGTRNVQVDNAGNLTAVAAPAVVTGTGANNRLTKYTNGPAGTIGNSLLQDNGTSVSVNYPLQANSQLFVYRQQTTATGDGQSTIYGYRDRNSQNVGASYGQNGSNTGVTGMSFWGDDYSFGVGGWNYNDFSRTGGVVGGEIYGNYWGSLGYKAASTVTYGVYGSNAYASGTGFFANNEVSGFGGGFFGVIGSASKGSVIGQLNSGELFSSYNSGNVYTLGKNVELVETSNNDKTPVYSVTSTESIIYAKGSAELVNGSAYITFKDSYKALLGENPEVTVTPKGNCNGVYISSIDKNGFTIKEMNNGTSTVAVSWISVGNRIDNRMDKATEMVSDPNFDRNIQQVLFNDSNLDGKGMGIWWDGNKIQFGTMPENLTKVKRPTVDNNSDKE